MATVGFIVPAFRMETMLENLLRDYDSSARLIIPGGQVFAKVDTPDSGISFEGEQGIAVYAYQSDRTGIQIELALNENKMFSRIREMQQMSYLVLILLLCHKRAAIDLFQPEKLPSHRFFKPHGHGAWEDTAAGEGEE
ncbi:MAG: hypothetical protein ACLR23_18165 [Clostridia bacterium]